MDKGPIGVFDSGYGGLTVLKEIVKELPAYDYVYLGDNARAPYGTRSFETVYEYTLQCVKLLFDKGCPLVIIACNTASAKALRNIQQKDLPVIAPHKRVLGVIRPTTEIVGNFSKNRSVGVVGTNGTVNSGSYLIEIKKFFPDMKVFQQACPLWVPLVESGKANSDEADAVVAKDLSALFAQNDKIDTLVLGCTHYPLLMEKIRKHVPANVTLLSQGEIVADGLVDYLKRHPEMEHNCTKNGKLEFFTTGSLEDFDKHASVFYETSVVSKHISVKN